MDLYAPFAQLPEPSVVWIKNNQFWVMRTAGNPLAVAAAARAALAEADPEVPAAAVRTLEQAIDGSARSPQVQRVDRRRCSATRRWR